MPQRFLITPTFFMVECLHDISKLVKFQEIRVMEKSSPFQMKFWHILRICEKIVKFIRSLWREIKSSNFY